VRRAAVLAATLAVVALAAAGADAAKRKDEPKQSSNSHTITRTITPAEIAAAKAQQDPVVLAEMINAWRAEHDLPPVPYSPLLSAVAEAHVKDMEAQKDGGLAVLEMKDKATGLECSPHSWSDGGEWTPVCYTPDNRYALAMYEKPKEITKGAYPGYGFEIGTFDTIPITPAIALEWWRQSAPHSAVVLEQGAWAGSNFQAMGVAIGGHFAYVWFGREADPTPPAATTQAVAQ